MGSLKSVTSTNERGNLHSIKGSLKMLIKEINDDHVIKLRGHIKQGEISKCNVILY